MSQAQRLVQALNTLQFVFGEASVEWLEEDGYTELPELAVHIADVEVKLTELRMKINAAIALKEHKRSCKLVEGHFYIKPGGGVVKYHKHTESGCLILTYVNSNGDLAYTVTSNVKCSELKPVKEEVKYLQDALHHAKQVQKRVTEDMIEIQSKLQRLLLQTST